MVTKGRLATAVLPAALGGGGAVFAGLGSPVWAVPCRIYGFGFWWEKEKKYCWNQSQDLKAGEEAAAQTWGLKGLRGYRGFLKGLHEYRGFSKRTYKYLKKMDRL